MQAKSARVTFFGFMGAVLWLPLLVWFTSQACCSSADGDCSHTPPTVAAASEVPPEPAANGLSQEGPWLLQAGQEGISACNQDGSGQTLLFEADAFLPADVTLYAGGAQKLNIVAAPSGGRTALVSIDNPATLEGLTLHILTLPDGTSQTITPLIAPEIEASDEMLGSDREDFARKVLIGSPKWSSDGQQLAFLAALEAPLFDLYIYDVTTNEIQRLTPGTYSLVEFSWSPDGRHLLFWGADWLEPVFPGLGVVSALGNSAPALYPDMFPKAQGSFIGWTGPETYLLHAWNIPKGNHDLRQFDILTGESISIWPGVFSDIAVDPNFVQMGLCLNVDEAEFHTQDNAGVYWIDLGSLAFQNVAPGCEGWIEWWPVLDSFLYGDGELYQLTSGGQAVMLTEDPGLVERFPDGEWQYRLNVTGSLPGLQIAPQGGDWIDVHPFPIEMLKWRPDGEGLFFLDRQGNLYQAHAPGFDPAAIGQNIQFIDWVFMDENQ